jgi:hypothetical protein
MSRSTYPTEAQMKNIAILFVLLATVHAKAEILFDGWARVLSAGQHVGYIVQRYEVDTKTKIFTSTYFLKTNSFGNEVTEGVKAQAGENLSPISYQYTSKVGKKTRVIDAVFEGGAVPAKSKKLKTAVPPSGAVRMVATITDDGKQQKIDKQLPQGTFLSTFLVYLMLQNKEGIKAGNNYEYSAIAEEDADVYKGTAFVKETTKHNGQDVFKVLNTYKDIQFINYITAKGETVFTKTPVLHLQAELVSSANEARKNIPLEEKSIKLLFGNIPGNGTLAGTPLAQGGSPSDSVAAKDKLLQKTPVADPSEKGSGVPPGKGIITKPGGTEPSDENKTTE